MHHRCAALGVAQLFVKLPAPGVVPTFCIPLQAKAKKDKAPSDMGEVEPFVMYSYLLTHSQNKVVKAWVDAIIAKTGIIVAAAKPADVAAMPKAKRAKHKATEQCVEGLFS